MDVNWAKFIRLPFLTTSCTRTLLIGLTSDDRPVRRLLSVTTTSLQNRPVHKNTSVLPHVGDCFKFFYHARCFSSRLIQPYTKLYHTSHHFELPVIKSKMNETLAVHCRTCGSRATGCCYSNQIHS